MWIDEARNAWNLACLRLFPWSYRKSNSYTHQAPILLTARPLMSSYKYNVFFNANNPTTITCGFIARQQSISGNLEVIRTIFKNLLCIVNRPYFPNSPICKLRSFQFKLFELFIPHLFLKQVTN